MSNIKKLLEGVEVDWKTLGEVCEIFTGGEAPLNAIKGYTPDVINKYPIYGNGVEVYGFTDSYRIDKDAVTISSIGANTGAIYFRKAFFTPIIRLKVVIPKHDNLLPKYIFHYLRSIKISSKKSSVPNMSAADVKSITIPIPCPDDPEKSLEIQKEIVRILDKFSTLTAELQAELTAELQARKSQYEYYRNQLLTYPMEESDQPSLRSSRSASSIQNSDNPTQPFSTPNPHTGNSVLQPHNKVEWKTLGKIAEYSHKRINAATIMKTNYVGVDNLLQNKAGKTESNYVPTEGNLTAYTVGDILIGNIRPYLKKIWLADNNGGTNGDVLVIHLTDKSVDTRYLYQVLADDNFFVYNMQYAKGAKMPRGNKQKIMEYQIPIPYPNDIKKSLEEQERIASILDKFNKITTSITEGLPKEIELRQKQYEYYRDLLLTFPTNYIKA